MHLTVHQSIMIQMLKIGSISNASVLQIGSAGSIQSSADLYNTGKFQELAEEAETQPAIETRLVPLTPPSF